MTQLSREIGSTIDQLNAAFQEGDYPNGFPLGQLLDVMEGWRERAANAGFKTFAIEIRREIAHYQANWTAGRYQRVFPLREVLKLLAIWRSWAAAYENRLECGGAGASFIADVPSPRDRDDPDGTVFPSDRIAGLFQVFAGQTHSQRFTAGQMQSFADELERAAREVREQENLLSRFQWNERAQAERRMDEQAARHAAMVEGDSNVVPIRPPRAEVQTVRDLIDGVFADCPTEPTPA